MTPEQIEQNARDLLKTRNMLQLCQDFEHTNGLDITQELADVRGWIMDELEDRNKEAFYSWMECEDPAHYDSPSRFFL